MPTFMRKSQTLDYRHMEATVTKSGALHHNFAAPELFGDWDAEDDSDDGRSMARTHKSDIYAFGCLYYEVMNKSSRRF